MFNKLKSAKLDIIIPLESLYGDIDKLLTICINDITYTRNIKNNKFYNE